MANRYKYGYRWNRGFNGEVACPRGERRAIASGYQGAIQGGSNVDLNVGDVVKILADGTIAIAEGSEITSYNPGTVDTDDPIGVIIGFEEYFDGQVMQPTNRLPGGTVYGTNEDRRSYAFVVPVNAGIWSVAIDTAAAAHDTKAEYLNLIGLNVDFVNSNDRKVGQASATNAATPELDISTAAVGVTIGFRIYNLDLAQDNTDYAGASYRLLVTANRFTGAPNTVGL